MLAIQALAQDLEPAAQLGLDRVVSTPEPRGDLGRREIFPVAQTDHLPVWLVQLSCRLGDEVQERLVFQQLAGAP